MSVIWQHLGGTPPGELADARLEMHWASQIPAAVGASLAEPDPDYAHLSFQWDAEREAMLGPEVAAAKPFRAGLRLHDLALVLVGTEEDATFSLCGLTLKDGLGVLEKAITAFTGSPPAKPLAFPEHELPKHPVGNGQPISKDVREEWGELARWFDNANAVLREVREENGKAAPVRTWPHHFDIATLITLDPDVDPEKARSINVGMSPGDGGIAEPYFYVTPWPAPAPESLPDLDVGAWHTEGWTGALLLGTEITDGSQQSMVEEFLESTVAKSLKSLEG